MVCVRRTMRKSCSEHVGKDFLQGALAGSTQRFLPGLAPTPLLDSFHKIMAS